MRSRRCLLPPGVSSCSSLLGRRRERRAPAARCVRYSLDACTSEGGVEARGGDGSAHGCPRPSDSGSSTTGTASTQPSAILRLPLIDAAALTMHVPSTPSVTAAKPSARPAGIADLRQQLAGADRGHVDAEEEVLRRRPCDRRPRRGSSSRRRARPAAAAGGWSGRWCRRCRRSCRGFAPARRRSARRPRRGSAGRAPRSTGRARCRSSSRRSRACRRPARSMPFSSSMRLRSISASGEPARAFITLMSVWPPASARAPSFAARSSTASARDAGRAYPTSRRSIVRESYKMSDPRNASRYRG